MAAAPPDAGTPWRHRGGPPGAQCPAGCRAARGAPSLASLALTALPGPAPWASQHRQTLLINRRTRRSRQRRRKPAFISARRGRPARLPALAGALPAAGDRRPRAVLSRGTARGRRASQLRLRSLQRSPTPRRATEGVGATLTGPLRSNPKERCPLCASAVPWGHHHPLTSWVTLGACTRATLLSFFQLIHTLQLCSSRKRECLPRLPPNLAGLLRMDCDFG